MQWGRISFDCASGFSGEGGVRMKGRKKGLNKESFRSAQKKSFEADNDWRCTPFRPLMPGVKAMAAAAPSSGGNNAQQIASNFMRICTA